MKKLSYIFLLFILFSAFIFPQELTREIKKQTILTISKLLKDNYVFEDVAVNCAKHLNNKFDEGFFDNVNTYKDFAKLLTQELQSISHDKHMRVRENPPRQETEQSSILADYNERRKMESENFGFAKVERLEGNVGYIDLRGFAPAYLIRDRIRSAMNLLEGSDALIFDLRKNKGGNPDAIRAISSYFFDKPTHLNSLYYRKENRTEEFWTFEKVEGTKMSDVPIYILTSSLTFSGGEEFANNLKELKRAVIVGETTGGGANPGGLVPINKQLGIFIPTGRAINPISKSNWEGVGVKPDIEVTSEKAFDVAYEKAKISAEEHRKKVDENLKNFELSFNNNLEQAAGLYKEKKNDEALSLVKNSLEQGTSQNYLSEESINMLGYSYIQKNNYDMALAIFQFNIEKYPDSWNVYDSIAETYMNVGNKELAEKYYKKSLELNPQNKNGEQMLKKLTEK